MNPDDRRFAKDVAKQLDRRQVRRKVGLYAALAGALAVGLSYLTCGHWGLGGKGEGSGTGKGTGPAAITEPVTLRCQIRVTKAGIAVDGAKATRAEAVAACKKTVGADVVVTGDARQGDWDELKDALKAAKIDVQRRDPGGS